MRDPEGREVGETIQSVGSALHVRRNGASTTVEIVSLEVVGELTVPRKQVPELIRALRRSIAKRR